MEIELVIFVLLQFLRLQLNSMVYNEKDDTSIVGFMCFGLDCMIHILKSGFTFIWFDFKNDSSSIKRLKIISNLAFIISIICFMILYFMNPEYY